MKLRIPEKSGIFLKRYTVTPDFTFSFSFLLFVILIFYSFTSTISAAESGITNQHKIVDGLDIYLGVLPAEMIAGPNSKDMHGGIPTGAFRYHVIVAVFNKETGKRIISARLKVKLSNSAGKTEFIELQTMNFNGNVVFGNYFVPKVPGPYRILVVIDTLDKKTPVEADFQYQIGHASL